MFALPIRQSPIALSLAALLCLGASGQGCTSCKPAPFGYAVHAAPRVFVSHHPLLPEPGSQITFDVVPELGAAAGSVAATVSLTLSGTALLDQPCADVGSGVYRCTLPAGDAPGSGHYNARVTAGGATHHSASYWFTVGLPADPHAAVELRRGSTGFAEIAGTNRIDIAVTYDPDPGGSGTYTEAQALADLEEAYYGHWLDDDALRWRDRQLGLYLLRRPGITTSYDAGYRSACGADPWPELGALPPEVGGFEVLGVIHRNDTAATSVEGTSDGSGFRDCAATSVKDPSVHTFSADGRNPGVFGHELGHAAFALGDEYWESTESREVHPASGVDPTAACCCCDVLWTPDPGTGPGPLGPRPGVPAPGGGGGSFSTSVNCQPPGTPEPPLPADSCGELPSCASGGWSPPPECFDEPGAYRCPAIESGCVRADHFLGEDPGETPDRRNIYHTEPECQAARAEALDHPGVEQGEAGLGACRQLCGPPQPGQSPEGLCPCVEPTVQVWYVDLDPGKTADDAMSAGQDHGSLCAWCVESTFCVRWERARGRTAAEAWASCKED